MTLRVHPDDVVRESTSPLLAAHDSWERVRLGDVADVLNGFAFKSSNFNQVGVGTALVRIRDVGQPRATTWYSGDFDARYLINDGDLLVGMDGDFRSARWQGGPALLNQRVCKITITCPDAISSSFLEYVLPGYLDEIGRRTSAITVKHLSSTTLTDLPLPLPPRPEQERIVAAIEEQFSRLASAEEALASATRRAASLRAALLAGVINGAFVTKRIGDLFEVYVGTTPPRGDPSLWNGGVPWVSSGEVAFCRVRQTRETISPEAVSPDRIHPSGTVLLAMIGEGKTRGQAAILDVAAAHNQNSAAIRIDRTTAVPEWVYYVLMARYAETRRVGSGNNQPALNKSRVREIEIPLTR